MTGLFQLKGRNKLLVFYDGWCPLCKRSKKAIKKADWLERIEMISFRDEGVVQRYRLEDKGVEERIYSIDCQTDRRFQGIETIVQIAKRTPPYWLFVPVIYVSFKIGMGQKVYDFIAKRRKLVPVGQCDENGCPVHKKK
jgi:predicted DCC family thiol-disulfide oxidoreductase YuxK